MMKWGVLSDDVYLSFLFFLVVKFGHQTLVNAR
jgi:hypothetical protein